jgi:hypothetical protein
MGTALTRFVKDQCANWNDEPEEECLGVDVFGVPFRQPGRCWVTAGESCKYFKDKVLGPEDCKYPHPCFVKDPAFEARVRRQYSKIDHTVVEAEVRRCPDCGAPLGPKRRYCEKCSKKRRHKTMREYHRKYRKSRRLTVIQLTENGNL